MCTVLYGRRAHCDHEARRVDRRCPTAFKKNKSDCGVITTYTRLPSSVHTEKISYIDAEAHGFGACSACLAAKLDGLDRPRKGSASSLHKLSSFFSTISLGSRGSSRKSSLASAESVRAESVRVMDSPSFESLDEAHEDENAAPVSYELHACGEEESAQGWGDFSFSQDALDAMGFSNLSFAGPEKRPALGSRKSSGRSWRQPRPYP